MLLLYYYVFRRKCSVLSLIIYVLYSFICASRRILFIDDEKILKNPANSMRATLASLFTCVCIAHVL